MWLMKIQFLKICHVDDVMYVHVNVCMCACRCICRRLEADVRGLPSSLPTLSLRQGPYFRAHVFG